MRLIVVVEGQTEETFVRSLLVPHFEERGIYISSTIVGKVISQKRGHQGRGGGGFRTWSQDLQRLLRGDPSGDLRVTTLFDLYGLPDDFPGLDRHQGEASLRRCEQLEEEWKQFVGDLRFLPYIQRHEFEALVLASLEGLRELLDSPEDLRGWDALFSQIQGMAPEEINDGFETAPSKRLLAKIPSYRKLVHGPLALEATGLAELRRRCSRFGSWISRLETLGEEPVLLSSSSPVKA